MQEADMQGRDDLLQLHDFSEDVVLHNIRKRYKEMENIFTQIGAPILISLNPFRHLPIFTQAVAQKVKDYSAQKRGLKQGGPAVENPGPHLFMVAEDTIQQLLSEQQNQSIIITGESGAGKTEACKIILAYVAQAGIRDFTGDPNQELHRPGQGSAQTAVGSGDRESVETYVLASNPVLEAFGNAMTIRNKNSSRFGKFIQVSIHTQQASICSAKILTYLLEKSRACSVAENERSFHIFYQGIASEEIRSKYQLPSANPADYGFLKSKTDTYTIDGVDDVYQCQQTIEGLRNINFSEDEIEQIWQIVIAVLLMGNVEYAVDPETENAFVREDTKATLGRIGELLQLQDIEHFKKTIEAKIVKFGREIVETPFHLSEAVSARNSTAKTVYGRLFNWIVTKVNSNIQAKLESQDEKLDHDNIHLLGLLDIFGFELFKQNSFEQMCINYANEKLQQHFNEHMIALEVETYRYELGEEALADINFDDSGNSRCLELFETRNVALPSLFSLINEQGSLGNNGNDLNLLRRIQQTYLMQNQNPHIKKASKFDTPQFMISHYAGDVIYDVAGFVEKNKDMLPQSITETLQKTDHPLMKILFPEVGGKGANVRVQRRGSKITGYSLSSQFSEQLTELVAMINYSTPRYVRCIKPNKVSAPDVEAFDDEIVIEQLRAGSMLAAIKIRKVGYGYRIDYNDFGDIFWPLVGERIFDEVDHAIVGYIFDKAAGLNTEDPEITAILAVGDNQAWKCGVTKLFIKDEARYAIEATLNKLRDWKATRIQTALRGKFARNYAARRLAARTVIQEWILRWVQLKRWKKQLMSYAGKFTAIVVRIQQRFRSKRQREKFMAYLRKRREAAVRIQRAFRRNWRFEDLVRNLNRRHEARLRLQRAFRWRTLQKAVFDEVMRRIDRMRQVKKDLLKGMQEEQNELIHLQQANERMHKSLKEKDDQIKELERQAREAISGDSSQQGHINGLLEEINRLRQIILLLQQRLCEHEFSHGLGYM